MREVIVFFGGVFFIVACVATGGEMNIKQNDADIRHKLDTSISTNAQASVTYAALLTEWQAANNQTKKDAVVGKLFAKLAGVEQVTAEAKKNADKNAGKKTK